MTITSETTGSTRRLEQPRHSLLAWLQRLVEAYARRRRMREDERFLLSQPDHILKDMGISRAEIEGAVRGSLRRD